MMLRHARRRSRQTPEEQWLRGASDASSRALDTFLTTPVFSVRSPLTDRDVAMFLSGLADCLGTGVPLEQAISTFADACSDGNASALYTELAAGCRGGAALSDLLAGHRATFSYATVALVKAGEQTGQLERALDAASHVVADMSAPSRALRRVAFYPIAGAAALITLFTGLAAIATPLLASANPHSTLKALTSDLLAVAKVLSFLLIPLLLMAGGGRLAMRIRAVAPPIRRRLDPIALRVPGVAQLTGRVAQARLLTTAGWLMRSGVDAATALSLAAPTTGNDAYADAALRAADRVRAGASTADALGEEPLYADRLAVTVRLAEQAGTLPDALSDHGIQLEEEARDTARALTRVGELLIRAIVGTAVLLWLTALFLPVLTASAS